MYIKVRHDVLQNDIGLRAIIMMTMLRHCRITMLRHCRILINIAWAYGPSLCKLTHTLKHIGLRANFMEEHNT